jgi:hypothetical protein
MEDAFQVEQDVQILDQVFSDNPGVMDVSLNCIEVTYLSVPLCESISFPTKRGEKAAQKKYVLFCFFLSKNCFIYCTNIADYSVGHSFFCQTV